MDSIRHHGTINILLKYCGWAASGIACDINCVISQVIIKLSSHGHRTSCKEGMIFVSHDPIDVETTQIFDRFTKEDWESYIDCYFDAGDPDDADDPIAWFRIPSREREAVIHLNHRAGKYVLIKLLQTDAVYEKIDLQYIGFIGYSGARAFASARLC
ncbi:uncharacterized protein BYT42DRAFT_546539 [Radiomyces spectabilis]|uniref:uncharacterized protein n=1 Tax=Radiomyces spectabilis TaxID=64574 RepID=UPI0022200BDE|nr:uncharacterized protein BYT42DRAFT_546539 [Radiomyces spectabilis]KAI8377923.1 hypothetical protein BYT42DRAFT_546539 [Radiomyces spectabilis]